MGRQNKYRRLWPIVGAVVVANAAGAYALNAAAETRADLKADQISVRWQEPVDAPPAAPDVAPAGPGTPAAAFIATLASLDGSTLLGSSALALTPSSLSPTTPACMPWPKDANVLALTPSRSEGGGVSVQVLTTPTGAGTSTVETWRKALGSCGEARVVSEARDGSPADSPAGFTASRSPSGASPILTQAVWSRGDVVMVVTYAPQRTTSSSASGDDLADLRAVTSALDAAVTTNLAPVCTDLAPTAHDATRNPTLAGYVPHFTNATLAVGPAPKVTTPARPAEGAAIAVPAARELTELAPVAPLETDDWKDSDGDGMADRAPALKDAERLPAPVLLDPSDFKVTGLPADPGAAPKAPAAAVKDVAYTVPVADPVGPGCGWAFTGTDGPADDVDALAEAARSAQQNATVEAAKVRSAAWLAQLDWAGDWSTWAAKDAAYAPVRKYLAAKDAATAAYELAVATHADSVSAYTAALAVPPSEPIAEPSAPVTKPPTVKPPAVTPPVVKPTPEPVPSPSPTKPAPEPTSPSTTGGNS